MGEGTGTLDEAAMAASILGAVDTATPTMPFAKAGGALTLPQAYGIAGELTRLRTGRGEKIRGWKIGFTNRTIWEEYGVHAPIWGPVYDTTMLAAGADGAPASCPVAGLAEPRIEPEIMFRLSRAPRAGMSEEELFSCVEAVSHGFEIVQSVFRDWAFDPADTVAACALHGRLCVGEWHDAASMEAGQWIERLRTFSIRLYCDGTEVDRGHAGNVLDSPLLAFRHFVEGFDPKPFGRGIAPGDIISTGTLTRALPVAPGEVWTTALEGLSLPGASILLEG